MEKAWEQVWVKACDDMLGVENKKVYDDTMERVNKAQLQALEDDLLGRAVHNSPPPLDDVGSDVSDMLDEKDPTLALLNDRRKTHGDYPVHAHITQSLKDVMRRMISWNRLSDCQQEALEMIVHKIGRILAGNPDHVDHWDDIAGYAKLVSLDITSLQE